MTSLTKSFLINTIAKRCAVGVKPGTREFGQRAQARKEALQRGGKNDLRVQTAYKTAKKATAAKNKIISGD